MNNDSWLSLIDFFIWYLIKMITRTLMIWNEMNDYSNYKINLHDASQILNNKCLSSKLNNEQWVYQNVSIELS
jgi:hypothetical protein